MTLAIFDLDNTLLGGDSDNLWGEFVCERGLVDGEDFAARNDRFYADYKAGTLDIDANTSISGSTLVVSMESGGTLDLQEGGRLELERDSHGVFELVNATAAAIAEFNYLSKDHLLFEEKIKGRPYVRIRASGR